MDDGMAGGLVYQMVDLMVRLTGCWWAVSLVYTTVDLTVRMTGCLKAASLDDELDDPMVMMTGCLSAVSSVEKNLMAVSLAEMTMLDCLLTAVVMASQNYLAEETDEVMVPSLAGAMDQMTERMTD